MFDMTCLRVSEGVSGCLTGIKGSFLVIIGRKKCKCCGGKSQTP